MCVFCVFYLSPRLSGLSPFMGDTDADTLSNVIKSQYDFNYTEFDDVSDEAKDLISRLLVKEKKLVEIVYYSIYLSIYLNTLKLT